ncbi:MAG TPA: ABC transporter ATP-binding protein [Solimonas sp.]|nr:ABC transporter ATP-binding protein [Solimonas sp.]
MIRITALHKRYPGAEHVALDDVSLEVPAGCVFGLLGPNGAGKTTLISVLTGMLAKDRGTVQVGGCDLDADPRAVRRQIGLVPQELAFYPGLGVGENLRLFGQLTPGFTPARLEFAIATSELGAHLAKPARALSGGLKRRLNLAIGLLGDARLLCLDEPTAGVDPQSRNFMVETVRRLGAEGYTVLYTSHYLDEIERACDRVAILDHGRVLVQGALPELLADGASLEALFLRLTHRALRD